MEEEAIKAPEKISIINRKIGPRRCCRHTYLLPLACLLAPLPCPMEGWDEGEVSDGLDQPDTPRVAQESGRNEDDPAAALLA